MSIFDAVGKQQSANLKLIGEFNDYLSENVSKKTSRKHIDNIELYLYFHNSYLFDEEVVKPLLNITACMVINFLSSDALIRTQPSSFYQLDSYLASFKKFCQWLQINGKVTEEDYQVFVDKLNGEKHNLYQAWGEFIVRSSFY